MDIALKLDRPRSLTDLAADGIRSAIIDGRLAFGAQLSEGTLAENLGISKTPVREALLRLSLEGLVEVQPQRGTFVFELSPEEVQQLCEFRAIAECAALELAMRASADAVAARLEGLLAELSTLGDGADDTTIKGFDGRFHGAILESCGNGYLKAAYAQIAYKIQALRARLPKNDEKVEQCLASHALIARQVREGKIRRALETLREHIRSTEDAYLAASRRPA